jgi:SAM-dependent methyltransferase
VRQELARTFIRAENNWRILDVGCGTAEILRYLPLGIEYWGYDISERYIDAAKRRFGKRGNFVCGELNTLETTHLPRFDAVLAVGVLHHLDDASALSLLGVVYELLREGGRLITYDPCLVPRQNPVAKYIIKRDRGRSVRNPDGYRKIAEDASFNVAGFLQERRWIPYTAWIMECSK